MMDSWIWQPGYPLVSARLRGRRARARSSSASPTATPRTRRCSSCPSTCRSTGSSRRCCSTRTTPACRSLRPTPSSSSTPADTGSCASSYDEALRSRLVGTAIDALTIVDRYNLVDDAWNAVIAGRLGATELLELPRGVLGRARPAGLAGDHRGPARHRPPARGRRVRRLPGARAGARRRRRSTTLGWEPAPAEDDLTEQAARPVGRSDRCARRRRRHAGAVPGDHGRPGRRRTPRSSPPPRPSWRRSATPMTTTATSPGSGRPPPRRTSCGSCTRSPSSPRPS